MEKSSSSEGEDLVLTYICVPDLGCEITMDEVNTEISRMKTGRAPGKDGIPIPGMLVSNYRFAFSNRVKKIANQGKKCLFDVMRQVTRLNLGWLPVKILCYLFDVKILPIITYSTESWAYDLGCSLKLM